ncbi:MAG: hypothetical protein HY722_15140, partial [Planctomycetes bacterium]|nr:hypothetical protein [Planctomycetota bacterium]
MRLAGLWTAALPLLLAQEPPPPPAPFEGIRLHPEERRLEVDGAVCLQRGPLELLACTRIGKVHEAMLVLGCQPRELNAALLLIDLERTPDPYEFGEARPLDGDRVVLEVSWTGEDGTSARHRAEDLVLFGPTRGTLPRCGFVYVGSRFLRFPYYEVDEDGRRVQKGEREFYMAQESGNLVATYHDPDCLLDLPLEQGGDDTLFGANGDLLPEAGTPVVLHVRAVDAEDPALREPPRVSRPAGEAPPEGAGDG